MACLPDPPEMRLPLPLLHVPRLEKSNFRWWRASLRAALKAHAALDALSKEPPTSPGEKERFDRMDGLAAYFILGSVSASAHPQLPECATAKQMLETLEKKYDNRSDVHRRFLYERLFRFRMREGDSVGAHLNKFLGVLADLKAAGQPPSDMTIIASILNSLPESFAGEVAVLTAQGDLTLESVCSFLEEEGMRREMEEEGVSGLGVGQKGNAKEGVRCFSCARFGHLSRDCRFERVEDGRDPASPAPSGKGTPRGRGGGNARYNRARERHVFAIHGRESNAKDLWLLDSGSVAHVANSPDCFVDLDRQRKPDLQQANGQALRVAGCGRAVLRVWDANGATVGFALEDCAFVPEATRCLISTKRIVQSGYEVRLTRNGGRITHEECGSELAVEEIDGCHYLRDIAVADDVETDPMGQCALQGHERGIAGAVFTHCARN